MEIDKNATYIIPHLVENRYASLLFAIQQKLFWLFSKEIAWNKRHNENSH